MHYFGLVLVDPEIVKQGESAIRVEVERLMRPYSELLKVPPYRKDVSEEDVRDMVENYGTTDLNKLAKKCKDWFDAPGFVDATTGQLYYMSTHNNKGHWDGWRIGGRWDGYIKNNQRESDNGFNWGKEHETLEWNMEQVRNLSEGITFYFLITPDGEWHEKQYIRPLPDGTVDEHYPYSRDLEKKDSDPTQTHLRRAGRISP